MKKKIFLGVAFFFLLLFSTAGILVARPCGNNYLVIMNHWGNLDVEIFGEGKNRYVLWSGKMTIGPPVTVRVYMPARTYRVHVKNLDTGEVREDKFGYYDGISSQTNVFLIDAWGIHYHDWNPKSLWTDLFFIGLNTLSCADNCFLSRMN